MTPTQDGPVARRRLRARLRQARTDRGLTQNKVADAMDWSLSKLIRIESGSVGISSSDLKVLLQHYGIEDPEQVDGFLDLARTSRREHTGWWVAYRGVASPQYLTFVGYESSASVIQAYQPLLIPGLLQEEEYARRVIRALGSGDRVNELVKLRMQRQRELFERPDPPDMIFVIDEAALHRWVGGREVMRQQLQRLRKEIARPNVTIEIIPFTAGEHHGMNGSSFVILQFAETEDDDVLFLENSRGDVISRDEQEEIDPYQDVFDELRVLANQEDPQAVIDRVLETM